MKILGIIPARGGSKGIPKKNIKLLNGKPLIAYTIEAALASNLDRVIVSTDCKEIAGISKEYGAEVIIRSFNLAEDTTPTLPVLQHVVSKLEVEFDAVMTLQPTSPLRTSKHINEAIELFESDKEVDSLVSVVEVPHNYMPEKLMSSDGKYLTGNREVKRRQEISTMYARNGAAIYITKTEKLGEYIFGGKILPYFMSKINSFDIDDIEDWEIVERLI
ncbi:acylneuraminate cytidylyltransferase family protein [Aliarcobacter butzleri]|uniref:acylneuraminate cytidylyltransferase family protein n=1 Tax=Aliarcobacter butzleri TaxID=28197 RepID=UPI002B24681D|nr:acylneuraminate cytidylyltransferase family protein [Aliarcobacter butzleri]